MNDPMWWFSLFFKVLRALCFKQLGTKPHRDVLGSGVGVVRGPLREVLGVQGVNQPVALTVQRRMSEGIVRSTGFGLTQSPSSPAHRLCDLRPVT